MNAIAIDASNHTDPLIDWTVDIARISRAAAESFKTGTPDPWTVIEAECVIDLIEAEFAALATREQRGEPVQASLRRLKAMRTEVMLAIKTLKSLEKAVEETDRRDRHGAEDGQSDFPRQPDAGLQSLSVAAA